MTGHCITIHIHYTRQLNSIIENLPNDKLTIV